PASYSWAFIKDTTAPDVPEDLLALPGHDKVHLTWTNPTGDASFVGVEIRMVGWTDYPEYGTPGPGAPSYPADETQGTLVTQTSAELYDDGRTPRDIYYYSVFAYDCAGNYSALGTTATDRSTSYWLGDINPTTVGDGYVDMGDLAPFSSAFGTIDGGGGWDNEADFGPTDDWSRLGIPLPDNAIDFEDLMVLAMNYGHVLPTLAPAILADEPINVLRDKVSFRLVPKSVEGGNAVFSIVMENSAKTLKGVSLTLDYGMGNELVVVEPSGKLVASQSFFGKIDRESGRVELCVAALGVNRPLVVTGEIAQIEVRQSNGSTAGVTLAKSSLRNLVNERDEVGHDTGHTPYVPMVSGLMQNHPNPFNPTTT
ncbi:MAG: hypothetical protein KAT30_04390, partial [Candidatus Krumholzibacteria bacterium]|nr:hypothetical protein [Candidatus Krumholzibacteria bacterium]